jgi:hypothetical protein
MIDDPKPEDQEATEQAKEMEDVQSMPPNNAKKIVATSNTADA